MGKYLQMFVIFLIRSHGSGRSGSGMSQYSDGKREGPKQHQQYQDHSQGGGQGHPNMIRGQRGAWVNRGNMRGRGRGGRGGPVGPGTNFRNPPNHPQQKKMLKFDNDYDFEQANTEFEELR